MEVLNAPFVAIVYKGDPDIGTTFRDIKQVLDTEAEDSGSGQCVATHFDTLQTLRTTVSVS